MKTIEEIRKFVEKHNSDTLEHKQESLVSLYRYLNEMNLVLDKLAAVQDSLSLVMSAINALPLCADEFLGQDVYRQVFIAQNGYEPEKYDEEEDEDDICYLCGKYLEDDDYDEYMEYEDEDKPGLFHWCHLDCVDKRLESGENRDIDHEERMAGEDEEK